jgi:hypothetical protein
MRAIRMWVAVAFVVVGGVRLGVGGAVDAELEKRGCCSHHKGVCGCEGGRALCCDGQLSPTCGC